jgi:hypothetical protein
VGSGCEDGRVRWTTLFLDFAPASADSGVEFWCAVTGSALSPRRGSRREFATLLPVSGDAYLRVQTLSAGPSRCHVDLHTEDFRALARSAVDLGAAAVLDLDDVVVLRSPGGFEFCAVGWDGEAVRPDAGNLLDQVCLDVPLSLWESEPAFWAELTGWQLRKGDGQFGSLLRPAGIPLRFLFQRRDDDVGPVRAHPDFACGDLVDQVANRHLAAGAVEVRRTPNWTTLRDPAGLEYCLTRRDPATGLLP